jgi:tryptophanyl-tRNA synthetase
VKVKEIDAACRKAGIGCTDCKKMLAERVAEELSPIHERIAYYVNHIDEINEITEEGNRKATKVARQTMDEVRTAVKI